MPSPFAPLSRPTAAGRAARHLLACAALLTAASASAFDLTVTLMGATSAAGAIRAALYTDEASWLKEDRSLQARSTPADRAGAVLVFRGLPAGRYAVSAFHDENDNDRLDTNLLGIPSEPYGFSRDARGRFGPPAFTDAVLDLKADQAITLQLK